MSLGPEIRDVVFTPVRFREGYDMAQVDDYLDRLFAAADRRESLAGVGSRPEFTRVRWREGYAIDEVDQFLDRILRGA